MRKKIRHFTRILLFLFCIICCTACGDRITDGETGKWGDVNLEWNDESVNSNQESLKKGKESFQKLKTDIDAILATAKNGKYENLNIICDEVHLPQGDAIQAVKFPVYEFTKNMTLREKLYFYKNTVFTKLYDMETVDGKYVVDLESRINKNGSRFYEHDYDYFMQLTEAPENEVTIGYFNGEKYQFTETLPEGVCLNASFGTLGTMFQSPSPFLAGEWETIKVYDCYLDDLSDAYLLMDGTPKTVAEAKAEIEQWLDAHFPLAGKDNGIRNEVYQISVQKIPDMEYHVFHAWRTLTYKGIRVREFVDIRLPYEMGVMGEAFMCESGKVDLMMGFVNCFDQGSVIKTYEDVISFGEVLNGIAYHLTEDTKFNLEYIGIEYRMFTEVVENVTYYNWIPYWCFLVENPKDDNVLRFYMNMENGEFE